MYFYLKTRAGGGKTSDHLSESEGGRGKLSIVIC